MKSDSTNTISDKEIDILVRFGEIQYAFMCIDDSTTLEKIENVFDYDFTEQEREFCVQFVLNVAKKRVDKRSIIVDMLLQYIFRHEVRINLDGKLPPEILYKFHKNGLISKSELIDMLGSTCDISKIDDNIKNPKLVQMTLCGIKDELVFFIRNDDLEGYRYKRTKEPNLGTSNLLVIPVCDFFDIQSTSYSSPLSMNVNDFQMALYYGSENIVKYIRSCDDDKNQDTSFFSNANFPYYIVGNRTYNCKRDEIQKAFEDSREYYGSMTDGDKCRYKMDDLVFIFFCTEFYRYSLETTEKEWNTDPVEARTRMVRKYNNGLWHTNFHCMHYNNFYIPPTHSHLLGNAKK